MTFDDVVTKTAVTMAVLVVTAALAWYAIPDTLMFPALILSGLVGFVVVLVVAFRRVINPALVLVYAAIEGVFIGMISKYFEYLYDRHRRAGGARHLRRGGGDAGGVQVLQHPRHAEVPEDRDHLDHRVRGGHAG